LNWSRDTKCVWVFPVVDGMKKMMGKKIAPGVRAEDGLRVQKRV